jgi:DNA recombination protein RmuC
MIYLEPLYLTIAAVGLSSFTTIIILWVKFVRERNAHQYTLQDVAALEIQAQEAAHFRQAYQDLRMDFQDIQIKYAELKKEQQMQIQSYEEKLKLLEDAKQHFMQAFEALSAQALEKSNRSFLNLAHETLAKFQESARGDLKLRQQAVGEMVSPLKEALTAVDAKLQSIEKERVGAYEGLKTQVFELANTQKELRRETANLVKALRTPHVRGRWGEMQLRRVVELSGMSPHCDFIEQATIEGTDGRLRPDMVVHLPAGKRLVIDAKAPLAAYLEALEAVDDNTRLERMRDHARQVKNHILALSSRSYWQHHKEDETPEFVILFLPGETFFSAALEHDPSLIELGVEKRVILATPTTLIALLHAIAYGWRQERLAENAREICNLGKELYKRLSDMGGHLDKLGTDLMTAVKSYNKTIGTIESRVLPSARRFKDLQATGGQEEIPSLDYIDEIARNLQAPEMLISNNDDLGSGQKAKQLLES